MLALNGLNGLTNGLLNQTMLRGKTWLASTADQAKSQSSGLTVPRNTTINGSLSPTERVFEELPCLHLNSLSFQMFTSRRKEIKSAF